MGTDEADCRTSGEPEINVPKGWRVKYCVTRYVRTYRIDISSEYKQLGAHVLHGSSNAVECKDFGFILFLFI